MARLTVEDCVDRVPNRFELVMVAAQRARSLSAGAPMTVERDNDKNPVVALREIADDTIDLDDIRRKLVHGDGARRGRNGRGAAGRLRRRGLASPSIRSPWPARRSPRSTTSTTRRAFADGAESGPAP